MKKIIAIIFSLFITLQSFSQNTPKVGLVLSGGGAKGFAHISVLKEIEKSGMKIDYISGTSMGAVIGALYASGYSADELEHIIYNTDFIELLLKEKQRINLPLYDKTYNEKYLLDIPFDNFKFKLPNSISKGQGAYLFLTQLLHNQHNIDDFTKLNIPFLCVATNLETGEEKVFENGFLPKAVIASAALPTLINPIEIEEKYYIDGGLVNNMPAEILKDKGMDIVIGVDLGQGLKDKNKMNGIQDILEQVSNFTIINNVNEQRKHVDFLINPKLKNYNVTDFGEKDSIFALGKREAIKFRPTFDSISKLQKKEKYTKAIQDSIYDITCIDIYGLNRFNSDYIKGKLSLRVGKTIDNQHIKKGVNKLFSTGNFEFIDYKLEKNVDSTYSYILNLRESENKVLARIGLHYDDIFKTGILLNLTHNSFLFDNTKLSFDLVLGDNIRYYFNFYSDNGIKPSIGFQSSFIKVPIDNGQNNINLSRINNKFYTQSTYKEKYALGIGIDHDYIKVSNSDLESFDPGYSIEDSYYIYPNIFLSADSQNNPNFPTSGLKFKAKGKYLMLSNQDDFRRSIHLNGYLDYAQTLYKNLSISNKISFGTSIDNNSIAYNNYIGGFNKQDILFTESFMGYEYGEINNKHKILLSSKLQYKIYKNNYFSVFANIANLEDELNKLKFFKYDYVGLGVGYGYDSPVGPIHVNYAYTPLDRRSSFYISLGYWF